jgi:hypothetical protein
MLKRFIGSPAAAAGASLSIGLALRTHSSALVGRLGGLKLMVLLMPPCAPFAR